MSANLILSLTPEEASKPYKFKATAINVYSFEEALYHCLRYWKQSIDDFLSEEFTDWVRETLALSFLASKIRELEKLPSFGERLTRFLSLTDYVDDSEIEALGGELAAWESRKEWEKLKERGDDLMNGGEPEKALALYRKALSYGDDPALYNNAAMSLMKQGDYGRAVEYLRKAVDLDPQNVTVILHLAEAHILDGGFEAAAKLLNRAEAFGENPDVYFFRGEIQERSGNTLQSVAFFEKAIAMEPNPHYIYRLADVFVKLRLFERAVTLMETVGDKDKFYLKKLAELHVANNNVPAAIKCMEKALLHSHKSADLWTRLAAYHRMDYDLNKAYSAITTALNIEPDNPRINLEYARIRKAQGRIKDYQLVLNNVLNSLKRKYRENAAFE